MAKTTIKLLIDQERNSLTFSKNFRIFTTHDPVSGITGLTDFLEDLIISSPSAVDLNYLGRYFRYSRNGIDWSLWYEVSPIDLGDADDIILEEGSGFYFQIKYEYDDGTYDELGSVIQVNEIKLRFSQASTTPNTFAPVVGCSDERCSSIIAKTDPGFKPYQVDSAIGMYKELSFYTNKIFGHEVVYFRTVPESDSGDFIFKEWTLFKNVDRKCIKVLVPKNSFPSNSPRFKEFGLDYELPFEIHIDHNYFQSIFGKGSNPRHRDFLYFPLINRMYEIQGAYLHRAFMMAPTYWKVSLAKYNPNIDMLLTDDSRHFLDNVVSSVEELFADPVDRDTKDATMPQQYSTISYKFDPSRSAIHPDLTIRPLKYLFNHANLIENYYDLESVAPSEHLFELLDSSPLSAEGVELQNLPSINPGDYSSYNVVLAYQNSDPFKSWINGAIMSSDNNVKGNLFRFVRVRGPFDTLPNHIGQSESGRYVRIEAYADLSYTKQRGVLIDQVDGKSAVRLKSKEASVIYNANPVIGTAQIPHLSFTSFFNVKSSADILNFITGFDNETDQGIQISGQFVKYFGSDPEGDLTLNVSLNSDSYSFNLTDFKSDTWHALVVSVSSEFNQMGVYIYSITEDPADLVNHNDLVQIFKDERQITQVQFNLPDNRYYIPSSNMWLANIRLFNTMIQEEDHDFILSQQYIKDESKLIVIDNCKPQNNLPYIAKNR